MIANLQLRLIRFNSVWLCKRSLILNYLDSLKLTFDKLTMCMWSNTPIIMVVDICSITERDVCLYGLCWFAQSFPTQNFKLQVMNV
jgi:hypothetical protein